MPHHDRILLVNDMQSSHTILAIMINQSSTTAYLAPKQNSVFFEGQIDPYILYVVTSPESVDDAVPWLFGHEDAVAPLVTVVLADFQAVAEGGT